MNEDQKAWCRAYKRLRSLPPEVRRHRALEYVGKRVQVTTVAVSRKEARIGKVIAVAVPNTGASADLLILEHEHPDPAKSYVFANALSLATIDSIEEIPF